MPSNPHKDVILSSSGITASLVLAEPTIFLSGFTRHEQAEYPPALVRGSLVLRITKPVKLKAITLTFKGVSRTEWPEGIPSEKSETYEVKEVFSHEWRLFSTQFPTADRSSGAHSVTALDGGDPEHPYGTTPAAAIATALQPTTTPHALVNQHDAVSKGYRVFNPAAYVYNFELMLPQRLPESIKCNFGQIKWGFHLSIERHGAFKPRLTGRKEVTLLRTLGPANLESSEPIVINRDWEDLLHYEIVTAGKAFAIGQSFNVAFALVPMAKVKCHRIRVYITEHTEYFCRNHRVHRVEPSHKFLLLEKKSPDGPRGDLLKTGEPGLSGLTEMEFQVEIPETFPSRRDYLRPNANTETIKVYHWIKAVMRLSREDIRHNGEAKCYEVSIDSPITLVDPRTLQANDLPDYQTAKVGTGITDALKPYNEFIQKKGGSPVDSAPSSNGSSLPNSIADSAAGFKTISSGDQNAHSTSTYENGTMSKPSSNSSSRSTIPSSVTPEPEGRAILFTRQPSIAPPPFDADVKPPDLLPPDYNMDDENAQSYELRYQAYLESLQSEEAVLADRDQINTTVTADNSSDSTASSVSRMSDTPSGSTVHTQFDDTGESPSPMDISEKPNPADLGVLTDPSERMRTKTAGKKESWADRAKKESENPMPVFSEIIWSEDAPVLAYNDEIDPQAKLPRSGSPSGDDELVSPGHSSPESPGSRSRASTDHFSRSTEAFNEKNFVQKSSSGALSAAVQGDAIETTTSSARSISHTSTPQPLASSPKHMQKISRVPSNPPGSTPRSIPKRGSISGQRASLFSSPASTHVQRLRASGVGPLNTGVALAGSPLTPATLNSMMARRSSMQNQSRLSVRSPTALSMTAGSPLTSPWGDQSGIGPDRSGNERQSGDRFAGPSSALSSCYTGFAGMTGNGSAAVSTSSLNSTTDRDGVAGTNTPRYFRQSSMVSVDISRQGELQRVDSRRPSRVGEIEELHDWHGLTRTESTASFAVSIAEYQSLHNERPQANAPLLGDEESEMDIGLDWERDFEDYDLESDRGSIVSAFYTVMTP